jgi:ribosomal protein L40E
MKVFNGRAAADEYMSTHSLTFSTPEMTLKKFVLWLSEPISKPGTKENIPRLMLYLQDRDLHSEATTNISDLMPDTDDTFRPSGAVTDMYHREEPSNSISNDALADQRSPSQIRAHDSIVCSECGSKLKVDSKFCRSCGARQKPKHQE